MQFLKKIVNYITTRYSKLQLVAILIVIVFAFLVSDTNIFTRMMHDAKIHELEGQIEYYKDQTDRDTKKLEELKIDNEHIEKYAREHYLMKKENEDIFIIE